MRNNKLIIGLTGGSGAGKTTVSDAFRKKGITVIDADKVAREIVEKGMPALAEIAEEFDGVIRADGTLDRKKLGAVVFSDRERLDVLNKITHKYITERIHCLEDECGGDVCVIDGAVLFESGIAGECDVMCAVTADRQTRISRITARDGLTREQAELRIDSQKSDAEYAALCSYVIDNSKSAEQAQRRAAEITDKILKEFK